MSRLVARGAPTAGRITELIADARSICGAPTRRVMSTVAPFVIATYNRLRMYAVFETVRVRETGMRWV